MMLFRRQIATFFRNFNAQTSTYVSPPNSAPLKKKTAGMFRGSVLGFLLGTTVAGVTGYSYLVQEYRTASELLMKSVEELQAKNSFAYIKRVDELEKQVKRLNQDVVTEDDVETLREEMKKIYNGLQIEYLELKSKVTDMDSDLLTLTHAKF